MQKGKSATATHSVRATTLTLIVTTPTITYARVQTKTLYMTLLAATNPVT